MLKVIYWRKNDFSHELHEFSQIFLQRHAEFISVSYLWNFTNLKVISAFLSL